MKNSEIITFEIIDCNKIYILIYHFFSVSENTSENKFLKVKYFRTS